MRGRGQKMIKFFINLLNNFSLIKKNKKNEKKY